MTKTSFDIVIIGGGLAGASLAVAMADTPYEIAIIEPHQINTNEQPSYDERTIALTYSARNIFTQIGIWTEPVQAQSCAIKSIHISNKGHFGLTHLSHQDAHTEALGYVVPTRVLGEALMSRIEQSSRLNYYSPYEATAVKITADQATVEIVETKTNQLLKLNAKLVIIADGGRSPLLEQLGFSNLDQPYTQSALLSIVRSNRPHQHKAYERFMQDGPLALLPMTDQRFAVVWTLSPDALKQIESLPDDEFLAKLQSSFGTRAGIFSQVTLRKAYPLSKNLLQTPYQHRILVLGNAAHTVHPVAGQGFNLSLRDVAALTEQLIVARENNHDIGALDFLERYYQTRKQDTKRVGKFTDGLLSIFTHPSPLIKLGRNVGLTLVENLPFVKRALLKQTMGLGKHQPRLVRGLKRQ